MVDIIKVPEKSPEKYKPSITLQKTISGFFTGLVAVVISAMIQAFTDYKPIACSQDITTNCSPQWVLIGYNAIIPMVIAFLVGIANWIKHHSDDPLKTELAMLNEPL